MMQKLLFTLIFLANGVFVTAQTEQPRLITAQTLASNTTPLLGEPFELKIVASVPKDVSLLGWVKLPLRLSPLTILNENELEISETEHNLLYEQRFEAVLWDIGTYITPEIWLEYQDIDGVKRQPFESLTLTVASQITDEEALLLPSIPPQDLPALAQRVIFTGIFVVTIILIMLYWVLKRRQGLVMGLIGGTPLQQALVQIEELQHHMPDSTVLYLLISQILRRYLLEMTRINTIEMTTSELLQTFRESDTLTTTLTSGLKTLLEQADLVKFAKFQPENSASYLSYTSRWLKDANAHLEGHIQ